MKALVIDLIGQQIPQGAIRIHSKTKLCCAFCLRTSELRTFLNNDGDITINATLIMLLNSKNYWKIFQGQMEKTLKEMRLWSKVTLFHKVEVRHGAAIEGLAGWSSPVAEYSRRPQSIGREAETCAGQIHLHCAQRTNTNTNTNTNNTNNCKYKYWQHRHTWAGPTRPGRPGMNYF